jgi:hypothetical protein
MSRSALLRQPCPAQTVGQPLAVIGAAQIDSLADIGHAQAGIELAQQGEIFRCVGGSSEESRTRDGDARGRLHERVALQRLLGPAKGFVVVAGGEVGERHAGVYHEHQRIDRAKPHRLLQVLDRDFGLAEPDANEAALDERQRPIRIQVERALDQGGPGVESPTMLASAKPAEASAKGTSRPTSAAFAASRAVSTMSRAVSVAQPLVLRTT